jgi:hypothetical protein
MDTRSCHPVCLTSVAPHRLFQNEAEPCLGAASPASPPPLCLRLLRVCGANANDIFVTDCVEREDPAVSRVFLLLGLFDSSLDRDSTTSSQSAGRPGNSADQAGKRMLSGTICCLAFALAPRPVKIISW